MEAASSVWVATSRSVARPCMSVVESTASCKVPRSSSDQSEEISGSMVPARVM